MDFIEKNKKYILAVILVLAAFLIFFRLTRADIQHDDAIYSFRAIGYFDYVDSQLQTTPIAWFGGIPWWSRLSFHDAPPLVFLIQFIFFSFFNVSAFVARLPFALAGLGSVWLLYLLTRKIYQNENLALLASFLLAIFSYHGWASRVGYLEAVALFFLLLTSYLFFAGLENNKKFLLFGLALGLTLLTKYTVFFLIPVIFFYLLAVNRKILFNKYFIAGLFIALLFFSPVIIYNVLLFQARGHFDMQLANLFGQDMSDWRGMAGGGLGGNYLAQAFNLAKQLSASYSLPLFFIIILSTAYIFSDLFRRFDKNKNLFAVLFSFFLMVQFALLGGAARLISYFNPILAVMAAFFIYRFYCLIGQDRQKKIGYLAIVALVCGFELFYNLNTNIFNQPLGEAGKHYSANRWENGGFNQLEKYFRENGNFNNYPKVNIKTQADLMVDLERDVSGKDVYVYDPNLNWFSTLWYFRRWAIYEKVFIFSASDVALVLGNNDWFEFFRSYGAKNIYYIRGKNGAVFDQGKIQNANLLGAAKLEKIFENKAAGFVSIYNINQELAFKIYELTLN